MNVLFVYSCQAPSSVSKPLYHWGQINFGISYMSSSSSCMAIKPGFAVLSRNSPWRESAEIMRTAINDFRTRHHLASPLSPPNTFIRRMAEAIKRERPDIFLVIGGVHATLNPTDVIADAFDALCIGEGEYPMVELCAQMDAPAGGTPSAIPQPVDQVPRVDRPDEPHPPFPCGS